MLRAAVARRLALALLVVVAAVVAGPDAGGPAGSRTVDPRRGPPQPVGFAYADDLDPAALDAYDAPGALVVAGRENVDGAAVRGVAAAGGQVLLYLDPVVRNPHGRYHALLFDDSACGPAVGDWPGLPPTPYGPIADFRPGGVLASKLACVLEATVADAPWIAGWFADDVGSRSSFVPDAMSPADRIAYRDAAVQISRTFREVADRHGLLVLVNGTWEAGSPERTGGGYPDPAVAGNALADGGTVEHHDGQQGYFGRYLCSPQWAAASPVTRGRPIGTVIAESDAGLRAYLATGCVAYGVVQDDYSAPPPPWRPFTATGPPALAGR